jgi:hypothetical protein
VTAYFVVDALRFEMGEELHRQLEDTGARRAAAPARLAELPTVTAVGMNALAPVASNGRCGRRSSTGRSLGFRRGEFG